MTVDILTFNLSLAELLPVFVGDMYAQLQNGSHISAHELYDQRASDQRTSSTRKEQLGGDRYGGAQTHLCDGRDSNPLDGSRQSESAYI